MKSQTEIINDRGSFRDNTGEVFWHKEVLYRGIRSLYMEDYRLLMNSGLYGYLTTKGMLIPHIEVQNTFMEYGYSQVIKPEIIPFISYCYEWSFSQLKDAALLTLDIQKNALRHGMSLKDASTYNIQYYKGKPVFIDTLSFQRYEDGSPWTAYGQFCRHFLAPLLILSYTDARFSYSLKEHLDGVPLDYAQRILPISAVLNPLYFLHVYPQIISKHVVIGRNIEEKKVKVKKDHLLGLLDNLVMLITKLHPNKQVTLWKRYYETTSYSDDSMSDKRNTVLGWTEKINPGVVWDLGGNNGKFCREMKKPGILFVCLDNDTSAIEDCYQKVKQYGEDNIIPLLCDLTNPTFGAGWDNKERKSLADRGPADLAYALALVHHLAIGNNIPLSYIRDYMSTLTEHLIIEFVPKEDEKVRDLLNLKEDIFHDYSQENFEKVFSDKFEMLDIHRLINSGRILYLMKRR